VDMGDRWNHTAREFELIDSLKRRCAGVSWQSLVVANVRDQEHVRAVFTGPHCEVFVDALSEDRGCEGPERLAELDLKVHDRLHLWAARVAEDRPCAECAWAELHAALEPPDDLLVSEVRSYGLAELVVGVVPRKSCPLVAEEPLDFRVGELGPE